ncbi:hypothetical protein Tco_1484773 [Tanacetum coccineum]
MKSSIKSTDLIANTPYYSRPIQRIQDFDESKDQPDFEEYALPEEYEFLENNILNGKDDVSLGEERITILNQVDAEVLLVIGETIKIGSFSPTTAQTDSLISTLMDDASRRDIRHWERLLKSELVKWGGVDLIFLDVPRILFAIIERGVLEFHDPLSQTILLLFQGGEFKNELVM